MTEGQSLLLLFAALYSIESLRWLPPRSRLLLGSGKGTGWYSRPPFQPIELAGASPVLLAFLPPLQSHLGTSPWLAVPAAEGLEIQADTKRPPVLLPWEKVAPRLEDRTLHLGGGLQLRCLGEEHARQLQTLIQGWIPLPQAERESGFLHHAAATLAPAVLEQQAADLSQQTRTLRWLGSLIFLWTFGVVAGVYRWLGESTAVLAAAALLLLLQLTQAFLFYRAARAAALPHCFWKALAMALLPQHAMRGADPLCDALTAPSHPLAARNLLGDPAWRKLAAEQWKKTCYQAGATAPLQRQALEAFFQSQDLKPEDLEPAPERQPGSALYCPGCHAQFQAGATHCRDCGGVALRAFE
ncbi:MAG TPA: hypothetical protein VGE29_04195 [Prosthecobacter sp.]